MFETLLSAFLSNNRKELKQTQQNSTTTKHLGESSIMKTFYTISTI